MGKLVVIGGIALDYLSKVKDAKAPCTQVLEYSENIGGMAYNTAVTAAQLDVDTRLVSSVGKDFPLLKNSPKLHFELNYVEGKTTRSFLFYDGEEERIYFYPNSYHDMHVENAKIAISRADWIHFAGIAPCFEELVEHADIEGKIVSFNPGYDLYHYDPNDAMINKLFKKTDYLIFSSKEASYLNKPVDSLVNAAAVVTMGRNGAMTIDKKERSNIPAFPVESKSPFGAGDTFTGTFIASMMLEKGLVKSARLASAAGSLAVEEQSTTPSLDWKEIEKRENKLD